MPTPLPPPQDHPIFRLHNEGLKHLFLGMVARKWGGGSFHFHMADVKMGSTWMLIVHIPIFILPCQFEAIFTSCPMKVQTFFFPSFLGGRGRVWSICFYGSLELETSPFKQMQKIWQFCTIFSHFWQLKSSIITSFSNLIFNLAFLTKFLIVEKKKRLVWPYVIEHTL